jgi:hypothetical protein
MTSKQKLLAAVTASGALLCLTVSADGNAPPAVTGTADRFPELLSLRVEQLREKLRSISPGADGATSTSRATKIDNIVQFFNFYNCMRPPFWRNC